MAIFKLVKVISGVLHQDRRFSARGPYSFLSDRMFSTLNCIYSPRAVYFQEPYFLSKNDEIKYFRKRRHIKDTSQAHTVCGIHRQLSFFRAQTRYRHGHRYNFVAQTRRRHIQCHLKKKHRHATDTDNPYS